MRASGERPSALAMRFGWGVVVGLSLTLFMLAVPARYEELAEVGRRPTRHQDRGRTPRQQNRSPRSTNNP